MLLKTRSFILVLSILFVPSLQAQNREELMSTLKSRIKICEDQLLGPADMFIDDIKNGYMSIAGTTSPCGCECSTAMAAFRNYKNEYLFLQSIEENCEWKKAIISSKAIDQIMPKNFGLMDFRENRGLQPSFDFAIFYLELKVPRYGTNVEAQLQLIPFGIKVPTEKLIVYAYDHSYADKSIIELQDLLLSLNHTKTLDHLLSENYHLINASDLNRLNAKGIISLEQKRELHLKVKSLYETYQVYSSLKSDKLVLAWNRQTSTFEIKEYGNPLKPISFGQFLRANVFWTPLC